MLLSRETDAVEQALEAGIAAGVVYPAARVYEVSDAITFAFDGDAVLFDGENERIFREQGLEASHANESLLARTPMGAGPFGRLLKRISSLQKLIPAHDPPTRVALVTARNAPAHERVLHTLDAWDVRVDQMFKLGGLERSSFGGPEAAHLLRRPGPSRRSRSLRYGALPRGRLGARSRRCQSPGHPTADVLNR